MYDAIKHHFRLKIQFICIKDQNQFIYRKSEQNVWMISMCWVRVATNAQFLHYKFELWFLIILAAQTACLFVVCSLNSSFQNTLAFQITFLCQNSCKHCWLIQNTPQKSSTFNCKFVKMCYIYSSNLTKFIAQKMQSLLLKGKQKWNWIKFKTDQKFGLILFQKLYKFLLIKLFCSWHENHDSSNVLRFSRILNADVFKTL